MDFDWFSCQRQAMACHGSAMGFYALSWVFMALTAMASHVFVMVFVVMALP